MDFAQQQRDPRRHLFGFGTVLLLHLVLGYALVNGLARKVVEVLKAPLDVTIIEEKISQPPPPPKTLPPPPKSVLPPPAYVPPPEVQVAAPAQPVLAATTQTPQPPAPPAAPPAPPAAPAIVAVGVVCPNHAEVRSRVAYPPQAQRLGLSGEVLVELTVGPKGELADVTVARSSNSLFNSTAINAVNQLHCVGQGRNVRVRVPFVFKLDN
jgi:protein TonB